MSGDLRSLYEAESLSIPQIAARLGLPRSKVRTALIGLGVTLRSRTDGLRLRQPDMGKHLIGTKRPMSEETKQKLSAVKLALAESTAAGRSQKPSGYIEITRGQNKGRGEHVVIMEKRIGRPLRADEVVHHIDENRSNNDENNLALMTYGGHARHHAFIKRIKKCLAP